MIDSVMQMWEDGITLTEFRFAAVPMRYSGFHWSLKF